MKMTSRIYQSLISIYRLLPFKKYLCLLIRFLKIPNEKFYRDLTFKGTFKLKLDQESITLHHFGTTIENELFWKGIDHGWEKVSLQLWKSLCKDARVIVDLGANTGIYSLIAAGLNSQASVYAFEPSAKTLDKMNQNIRLNGFQNILTLPFAVSNKNGEATFFDFDTDHQYSASLNKDMIADHPSKMEVKVPVITLDKFIREKKMTSIDLLKIDVEMHEVEVLEGFREHLKLFMPTMIIEILTQSIGKGIEEQLSGLDYIYFNIDELNSPVKVDHLSKSDGYNFLICREDVAKKLQLI